MAKILNFNNLMATCAMVSQIPRDVFADRFAEQLSKGDFSSLAPEELSRALDAMDFDSNVKTVIDSLLESNGATDPATERLEQKIDALTASIEKLNENIEKLITR